jgi:hypothetical protein
MPTSEQAGGIQTLPPPMPLLALAVASVVLSAGMFLLSGLVPHVAGYLFGSIVAIALVGLFHRIDLQRRQSPYYVSSRLLTRWAGVVVAVGFVIAGVHTWWIATELAK